MEASKIITFGSCLSRITASKYVAMFGGEVVSSVFHNRSDTFLGRFVDRTERIYPRDEFLELLAPQAPEATDPNENVVKLLLNQYEENLGRHLLDPGIPFFEALSRPDIHLIVVDNFNDLRAKILTRKDDPNVKIFLRLNDFRRPEEWELGPNLDPKVGAASMSRILHLIKDACPQAAVVFINLPHNTYTLREPKSGKDVAIRQYEEALSFDRGLVIPCQTIRPAQQEADPQHFASHQYCAYAGWIRQYVASHRK